MNLPFTTCLSWRFCVFVYFFLYPEKCAGSFSIFQFIGDSKWSMFPSLFLLAFFDALNFCLYFFLFFLVTSSLMSPVAGECSFCGFVVLVCLVSQRLFANGSVSWVLTVTCFVWSFILSTFFSFSRRFFSMDPFAVVSMHFLFHRLYTSVSLSTKYFVSSSQLHTRNAFTN